MRPVSVLGDLVRARRGPCSRIALRSSIVPRYWACAVHCGKKSLAKSRFAISLQSACARLPREEHVGGMLLQLTRSMRIRVGRFIALAYLFCVLAPAAALAWGNGPAPCLDDVLLADLVPIHQAMPASHMHDGATHDHAGMHAHHQTAAQDAPAPHHHDSKGKAGPCCAMMCVSALPADLPVSQSRFSRFPHARPRSWPACTARRRPCSTALPSSDLIRTTSGRARNPRARTCGLQTDQG